MTSATDQPAAPLNKAIASPPLLMARNLHRVLGTGEAATDILQGVSLNFSKHTYTSIVGASGSGKSTLLYLLGGLDRPSRYGVDGQPFDPRPSVVIDGQDTNGRSDAELALLRGEKVGFVFQFHYLLKEFTAQENVALPIFKLGKKTRRQAMERAATLLELLGLSAKMLRRANRLSGGEQQRVAIARALANEPAVVLADEPTGNLDRYNSERVADIFEQLSTAGQAIVMVTHDLHLARRARRMITMEDGRIIANERLRRPFGAPGEDSNDSITGQVIVIPSDDPPSPQPVANVPPTPEPTTAELITPELTAPELTAPESIAPEPTAPEPIAPEPTAPESTAPEPTTQDSLAKELADIEAFIRALPSSQQPEAPTPKPPAEGGKPSDAAA